VSGNWVTDHEKGRPFRAVSAEIAAPNTLSGIGHSLGSGLVNGIGPVYASHS
jgi:exodeoxyribonuclease V alpha subunit